MQFRFIDDPPASGFVNMATDEVLLASALPVLRFYAWQPACLSVGYFQKIETINTSLCRELNIDIVRRLTGGSAVLHKSELTYSLVCDAKLMPRPVIESYKAISAGLLQGLKNVGLNPVLQGKAEKGRKSSLCFNDPSRFEVTVNGKKIIGSAQKRINGKILQHGSILIKTNAAEYCSLFNLPEPMHPEHIEKRMTSVDNELGEGTVGFPRIKEAVKDGLKNALRADFKKSSLTPEERRQAENLATDKYMKCQWNYLR
jgi:lipoate-protein ligase A